MRPLAQLAAIIAACLSAACALHRPALETWRLENQSAAHPVLIPPGIAARSNPQLTIASPVPLSNGSCPQSSGVIEIKSSKLTVFPNALAQEPPGWLAQWSAQLETAGCIAPGAAPRLAAQLAESVPLPLNSAFHLLHPNSTQSGQVDIGPQMRLEVISPILKANASSEGPLVTTAASNGLNVSLVANNFIGYEAAWYAIRPRPQTSGFVIIPESAERHVQGETEKHAQPATNYLRFPPDAAFYRLFYKSGDTSYTAFLVAGRTWPELEQNSAALARGSCASVPSGFCLPIPKRVAINPFVSVTVNGSPLTLAWGSSVADAIRHAGERRPAAVLDHLCIERLYKGRPTRVEFNGGDAAILNLVLSGGEVISWKIAAHDSSPRR